MSLLFCCQLVEDYTKIILRILNYISTGEVNKRESVYFRIHMVALA